MRLPHLLMGVKIAKDHAPPASDNGRGRPGALYTHEFVCLVALVLLYFFHLGVSLIGYPQNVSKIALCSRARKFSTSFTRIMGASLTKQVKKTSRPSTQRVDARHSHSETDPLASSQPGLTPGRTQPSWATWSTTITDMPSWRCRRKGPKEQYLKNRNGCPTNWNPSPGSKLASCQGPCHRHGLGIGHWGRQKAKKMTDGQLIQLATIYLAMASINSKAVKVNTSKKMVVYLASVTVALSWVMITGWPL